MTPRNTAHAERVLSNLEAQGSQQWPLGTAPVIVNAAVQTKAAAVDLAAMLRRAEHHLASLALVEGIKPEVARTALAFVNESRALRRRLGVVR
jgi:hypothetical protein